LTNSRRTTVLLSALLLTGCADAPISLKYDAKAAIDAAREARAEEYAPEILARAESAYKEGLWALQAQADRWSPVRDYGVAEARLSTALGRARLAVDLAGSRRRDLEQRTHDLLGTARGSIGNLEFMLSYLSPRTRARADLMRARILCDEAAAYEKKDDLPRAVERADLASHEVAILSETLGTIIGRYTGSDKVGIYRRWVQETVAASAESGSHAILVDKVRHTLTLLKAGRPVRSYRADIGLNGAQDKSVAGDKATPEGQYKIIEKKGPGRTRWYKALLINYPNERDEAEFDAARRRGAISSRARIGGLIEIHGEGGRFQDWTDGCIALENDDIDELFDLVSIGTPITIVGYESDDWLGRGTRSDTQDAYDSRARPKRARARAGKVGR
jgi:L,D-transpeptidase-like protein